MVTNGYMLDQTHENTQGSTYLANFVWNDLGFFALRTPRVLAIQPDQQGINLSYQTVGGIVYTLESSPDFISWQQLFALPGNGFAVSTNLARTGTSANYRLRLQPAPN
jgi:hypothetical protein